ncbi:hypothetical protein [Zobellia galactanivorans]|uniref:hypothetical protein n=1 Tax=Zobellia galactanivorans (strain DSM 12802 / CCUG 47099 / CIP 106680 / NCIMB 13871 / Dsij) TaxID=63186 RepID=UPI001C06B591|nr:hypothetical protein [Zobellia galactanivorans]MBU3026680.1 hypothetical protein [Zobellia galactanivorans]
MISIIFGKTKPINFIIVYSFLFVFYWFAHYYLFQRVYEPFDLIWHVFILAVLFFSVFLVNFIVKRNKVTGLNSYAILFYGLLVVIFPETLIDSNAVFCSFFLLLATRRLISLRSLKNIKFKIFDATIWILAASLFYDWALLYMILVFAAIYFYEPKNIRNWLVPLAGAFTVVVITECVLVLANNQQFFVEHYTFRASFDVDYFSYWGHSSKLVLFALATFVAGLLAFLKLGKAGFGKVVTMRLIAFSFVIGLVLNVFMLTDNVYPVMITFFPSVVFMTKYVESLRKANMREIVLMAAVIIPFLVLATGIAIK